MYTANVLSGKIPGNDSVGLSTGVWQVLSMSQPVMAKPGISIFHKWQVLSNAVEYTVKDWILIQSSDPYFTGFLWVFPGKERDLSGI